MYDIKIERVNLNGSEREEVDNFLRGFGLILDDDVEYTIVAKADDRIEGTCSFSGKVLKCFAVNKEMQGEGIASKLITKLTDVLFEKGIYDTFIFTKPLNRSIFEGMGYREVFSTEEVVFLEGGMANINRYIKNMSLKSNIPKGKNAGIVMNCNPFTLGHRYLIEKASVENENLIVFIVEENKSLFPFDVRMGLVKKGTKDLKNVYIIPGGDYIISSTTFPSYFIRREDERLTAYTKLDAGIFGKFIAPEFNIVRRYVGTEPYCMVTEKYNNALLDVLPRFGIEVKLIERLEEMGKAVSASDVRDLIRKNDWENIKKIVPVTTYEYLISNEASEIIENIKRSDSPH